MNDKYTKIKEEYIDEINANVILARHIKSGARVLLMETSDNNKVFTIGFRTPPFDDSGVAHILEHSTLCGSKKFPVKDPFVELIKSSMNTFLNAMTYSDKTIYPCASCNLKDFKNLMEVYMDAVFCPNVYEHPEIFKQEGWHYELNSLDDDITINGIVYNEMKGVFSNPEDILERQIRHLLFPDTIYGFESGGDPDHIPDLSYGKFVEYHKRYYSPANSYIVLYGDMDMEERLDWMDKEYLSKFDVIDPHSSIEYQEPFKETKYQELTYPINKEDKKDDMTFYSYNVVAGEYKDAKTIMGLDILLDAVLNSESSTIKKRLTKENLGTDIYAGIYEGIKQPYVSIVSKNAKSSATKEFVQCIEEELQKMVKEGIDKECLYSMLNNMEFKMRQSDYGNTPKGLILTLDAFITWLHDDNDPFSGIKGLEIINELRDEAEKGYFEKLIQDKILNNKHKLILTLNPTTKSNPSVKKLAEKMKQLKASMTKEELLKLIEDTKKLKEYQKTPSTKEELATLPTLTKEDLPKESIKIYNKELNIENIKVLKHEINANEITYLSFLFNLDKLPQDLLQYAALLTELYGNVNTKKLTYEEIDKEINKNLGSYNISLLNMFEKDTNDLIRYFEISTSCFDRNLNSAFDITKTIIFESLFDDEERIKTIIRRLISSFESFVISDGHQVGIRRAGSYIDEVKNFDEEVLGLSFYQFLINLMDNFNLADLKQKLNEVQEYIFTKQNFLFSFTTLNDIDQNLIKDFYERLLVKEYKCLPYIIKKEKKNEAIMTSSMVNYVTMVGKIDLNNKQKAVLSVANVLLRFDYLWNNIRVLGGAYGAAASFGNKTMSLYSYRDPNLDQTIKTFKEIPDYFKKLKLDEKTLMNSIISSVGAETSPKTVKNLGTYSRNLYLTKRTQQDLQESLEGMINCTKEDLQELENIYKESLKDAVTCVVGNKKMIEESAFKFDDKLILNNKNNKD